MTDTMILRVEYDNSLSAISIDGKILWSVRLRDAENKRPQHCSLPVALEDGACLVALSDSICVYDANGHRVFQEQIFLPDDSGCAPNITKAGQILYSSINGEIWCVDSMGVREVGCFGYDVLPPAIYPDNSLAIAGYYGDGFCRVSLDGQMVWKTEFKEADMLPTINQDNIAAVGSKNDKKSAFFSPNGTLLGTYARASVFAEYSPDSWIARSDKWVAKLTVDGSECWTHSLRDDTNLGHCQPIVDSEGRIYLLDDGKLLCLTGEGEIVFSTDVHGSSWGGLSCVSPGKMAYVGAGMLQIIE
ncbi:PQQ-binding-like beta-propeller repeat protein [Desulfobacter hydrogenophilus]|nr:PQQ-binding-like beta-propeller repeat protein [Desulfobacter hydrogenophilus]NDY73087.1 PQQ-like beta-propeller repeat protein [Desulfobacter hydrogenophilus]QBH13564.1 hypothetical protein EYB58_11885 [Desulfobacter hydrogenophilus]